MKMINQIVKQKPCGFCRPQKEWPYNLAGRGITLHAYISLSQKVLAYIESGKLKIGQRDESGYTVIGEMEINFCPMCGRSLKTADSEK